MPLPETFLQELLTRSDIESVVSSYVRLKRRGRNLVGLCPFHGEKTPSFNLYPETSSFYCFGCGAGGDVITFIKKIENLDYLDAVKFLADRRAWRCRKTPSMMPLRGFGCGFSKPIGRRAPLSRAALRSGGAGGSRLLPLPRLYRCHHPPFRAGLCPGQFRFSAGRAAEKGLSR